MINNQISAFGLEHLIISKGGILMANGKILEPVAMSQELSHLRQIKGKRGGLKKQLRQADFSWFLRLLQALLKKDILLEDPLCDEYVSTFVCRGEGWRLLDYFFRACRDKDITTDDLQAFLIFFFVWLNGKPELSCQIIKKSQKDSNVKNSFQWLTFALLKRQGEVVVCEPTTANVFRIDKERSVAYFFWPVPAARQETAKQWLAEVQEVSRVEDQAIENARQRKPDWKATDTVWERITREAAYGLHLDGGDYLRFRLTELNGIRLEVVMLHPEESFPDARVIFEATTLGITDDFYAELRDGRLVGIETLWCEEICWLVTMAVLAGYWCIVSPNDDGCLVEALESCHNHGNGKDCTRRPAKPHPLRLRPGYQASREAIDACIRFRGREPRPGYSFRVPKKVSQTDCCGRVSATITQQVIESLTNMAV